MKHSARISFLPLFLFVSVCSIEAAFAADPNKPHPHNGKIKHYDGAPPEVSLTPEEAQNVNSGEPIYKTIPTEGGGRAVAVFKVGAPSHTVWSVISDFAQYPKWIGGKMESTKIYKREGDKIFVEFTLNLGLLGGRWVYYVEHNYPMGKTGWATWKLDYSRLSDLDDSVGFWRVRDVSNSESIVTYSVDIASAAPDFIKNMIVKSGLKEATQWVKKQSEAATRN